ncbi:hypothetical protein CBS101457_000060 [Exobasidium rhododendri]|nr:hypothetical protein CBS101457_000060 [Exobasidium rhododendri]
MVPFISNFLLSAGFLPGYTPHWRPERDMPDLTGKVIVVTGANTGIGFESIKHLLKQGAKVYALSRTPSKGEKAVKDLNDLGYKGEALLIQCDLADLKSVRKAADEILAKEKEIHIVFCNAGIMLLSKAGSEQKTAQGHEIQFGTNVLAHHLLVRILTPAIVEAASHSEKDSVRIIFTSSSGHFFFANKKMMKNWDLSDEGALPYKPQELYCRSKLGNIHQAHKFADELGAKGVIAASVHPGNIQSELARYAPSWQQAFIAKIIWPVYYGAISQLYAGTAKGIENLQRAYFVPWARMHEPSPSARNAAMAQKTWDWCEEQSKGF